MDIEHPEALQAISPQQISTKQKTVIMKQEVNVLSSQ
jgi:hypothetical protein